MDQFIKDKFTKLVNSEDGFAISECKKAMERRMLEFRMPILYPKKPMSVTIIVENTIFGALSGDRKVD